MSINFDRLLGRVTGIRGVVGAVVLDAEDGLVIAESILGGIRVNAVAALAASMYRRVSHTTKAAGHGPPDFVQLQAENGVLIALPGSCGTILAVIGELDLNIGLVKIELNKILVRQ